MNGRIWVIEYSSKNNKWWPFPKQFFDSRKNAEEFRKSYNPDPEYYRVSKYIRKERSTV